LKVGIDGVIEEETEEISPAWRLSPELLGSPGPLDRADGALACQLNPGNPELG
jgi:hypothetical protein